MSTKTGDDTDTIGNIEEFIRQCLEDMEPDRRCKGLGRPRILPAMALWGALLVCVLRGFGSQLAVWRLVSERGLWFFPRFPVTDQAVYKRLHTAGTKPLERLFEQVSSVLAERLQGVVSKKLAPFAKEVVCIDESTLDAMARRLPTLREIPQGDSRLLPGKLAGVFDVRRQQWRTVKFQPNPHQNEKVLARDLGGRVACGHAGVGRPGILRIRLVRLAHRSGLPLAEPAESQDQLQSDTHLLSSRRHLRWHRVAGSPPC